MEAPAAPLQAAAGASALQAEGDSMNWEGGRVFVRNTFLDLDDVPRMPELQRARTAPAGHQPEEEELVDSDDEPPEERGDHVGDLGAAAASPDDSLDAPPPPAGLYRMATFDGYEATEQWKWGDPNLGPVLPAEEALPPPAPQDEAPNPPPPAPQDALAPSPPQAQPMPPPAGFIIVPGPMPAGQMPMGAIGMGPASQVPPGYIAVPVDPYARWPTAAGMQPMPAGMMMPGPMVMPGQQMMPMPVGGMVQVDMPPPVATGGYDQAAPAPAPAPAPEPFAAQAPPAPTMLQRTFSVNSGIDRVHWTVDARKLKSNDKVAVSPQFKLSWFAKETPFKMLIHPKFVSEGKGGGSFRKAKGRGKIELKCEGVLEDGLNATVRYRVSIGSGVRGDTVKVQKPRPAGPAGAVTHNFANSGVSSLPKEGPENPDGDEWDFQQVVDDETQTFVVCLELLAGAAAM